MPMPFMPFMPHRRPYTMFAPPCPCTPPGPPPEPHTPRPRAAPWGAVSIADALRGISSHLAELDETLAGMPKVITVNGAPLEPEEGVVALSLVDSAVLDGGYLRFKAGDAVLFSVDASPFIKDGMVDAVGVADGNLVITFNTDSGKQPVSIPLTDIFDADDYYDKAAVDGLLANKVSKTGDTMTGGLTINNANPRLLLTNGGNDLGLKIVNGNKYIETEDYDYRLPDSNGTLALTASNPTADHLAALDADGNPMDSGIAKTDVAAAQSVTWSELKSLRDSGGLVPGRLYRITDYEATTNGNMSSQSAGHPFDVIVTADSSDRVNEHARAAQHAGDQYFSGRGLHAWDVWYCLDNDANRFAWASASGKGVVYRLVDEWGNDLPYDFKGLKFTRDGVAFYTFDAGYRNGARVDVDRSLNGSDGYVTGNVMKPYTVEDNSRYMVVRHLNNNVCFGYAVEKNSWDEDCHGNTLGDKNISTANCSFNVFGKECRDNSFGPLFLNNTLGAVVHDCTYVYTGSNPAQDAANPGTWCQANTIGPYCANISMVRACSGNVFDYGCLDITLAQNCKQNSFGAGCSGLSLGMSCLRNTFTHGYRSESPDPVIAVPEGTNRKVFTTADDAAATPGALKKVAVTGAYSDLAGTPSLDDAVTRESGNGVKSSGIWSALSGKADSADLRYRIAEAAVRKTLSADCFPVTFTYNGDSYAINALVTESEASAAGDMYIMAIGTDYSLTMVESPAPGSEPMSVIEVASFSAGGVFETSGFQDLQFGGVSPVADTSPTLADVHALADRTVNLITATTETSIDIELPAPQTGRSRDFYLAVTCGSTAPTLNAPSGVTLVNAKGEQPDLLLTPSATTVLRFTEIKEAVQSTPAVFCVTGGANGGGSLDLSILADEFNDQLTYEEGDIVQYQGGLYVCEFGIDTPGPWDGADWTDASPVIPVLLGMIRGKADSSALDEKADSTALAPDWDPTKAYLLGEHVSYTGKMYECILSMSAASQTNPGSDTTHWKLTDLAAPDATLDLLSDGRLRLVAADGQVLWAQGYDLASASSTTLSCNKVNLLTLPSVAFSETATYAVGDVVTYDGGLYAFTAAHSAGAWDSSQVEEAESWDHALTMPDPPSGGKVGDFVLDVDNSANAAGGGADAKLSLTGMFTAFSLVAESGGNVDDLLTVAAGEMAELYFTLTAFKVDSLPTWKVARQTVESLAPEVTP